MGSSRSSTASSSSQQTQQQDNRVAIGNDGAQVGAFGSYTRDSGNASAVNSGNTNSTRFDVADSSQRNNWQDFSDRSSAFFSDSSQRNLSTAVTDSSSRDYSSRSSTSYSDASQRNDSSFRDFSDRSITNVSTTDGGAVEISRLNAGLLGALAETNGDVAKSVLNFGAGALAGANDLARTSSATSAQAWGHTIDKSSELIDHLLLTAQGTVSAANGIAGQAIASYMPTANKQADAGVKVAYIAGGAVLLLLIFKGK